MAKRHRKTKAFAKRAKRIVWSSNFQFHKYQALIERSLKPLKWVVVRAGRRGGKTAAAKEIFCRKLTKCDRPAIFWWAAPTFERSKKAYIELKSILGPAVQKKSDSDLTLLLVNGATAEFKSLKEYDNLRGEGLSGIVIDEAAHAPEPAWKNVIIPALLDNKAWALLISTPKGKNWFYKEDISDKTTSIHWTSYDNPFLPEEAIEKLKELKEELPEDIYRQEILAEYIDGSGGVFRGLRRCLDKNPYLQPLPNSIYCGGIDLGRVNDFTVVCVYRLSQRTNYTKPELIYLDRFTDIDWSVQRARILETITQFPGEYQIDATWNDSIYEELSTSLPTGAEITPVKLSQPVKVQLIKRAQVEIANGRLLIPDEDEFRYWWHEHEAYEYQISQHGNLKYSAPEGEHDDVVIASCLAVDVAVRYSSARPSRMSENPVRLQEDRSGISELLRQLNGTNYRKPEVEYFPQPDHFYGDTNVGPLF